MVRIILLLLVTAFPAYAIDKSGSGQRFTGVVDGDTIWFKGEKIRMMGYDTPEPQTNICGGNAEKRLAAKATTRAAQLPSQNDFSIERDGEDRYGRTLATIQIGGQDIGDRLVAERLARYWPNGPEFWRN